jgi:hypothetical protein
MLLDSRTEDDELDDYERIEISLADASSIIPEQVGLDDSRRGLDNNDQL